MEILKNIEFLVIVGPTAIGKSELAIELAKQHNGEIINGDSVQVYKGLDIGSAKITKQEMNNIKHHLLDVKEPWEPYNAYQFQQDCKALIKEIQGRNKLPIIVGGTGLYLNTIIYDYQFEENNPKDEVLLSELNCKTNQELYEMIADIAQKDKLEVHVNNRQRNLNYAYKIKKNIPLVQAKLNQKNCQIIGLTGPRKYVYDRIDTRVEMMIEAGLIDEVKQFERNWESQKAIGYLEVHKYLNNELTKEEMIDAIKKNTRHFAKKQWTWFNNKVDVKWYQREGEKWQLVQN